MSWPNVIEAKAELYAAHVDVDGQRFRGSIMVRLFENDDCGCWIQADDGGEEDELDDDIFFKRNFKLWEKEQNRVNEKEQTQVTAAE